MSKVPQDMRSAGHPQLRPEVAGGADLLVVTVDSVMFKPSQFRKVDQPVLTFAEFPEHEWRVGKRSTDRICEALGEETDEWVGEKIPLVKAREEVGRQTYVVYQAAPPEDWKDAFKRAAAAKKGRR